MKFCTVINCIDGRVQLPVIAFLKERFGVDFVDSVTEAGPNLIISQRKNDEIIQSIYNRVHKSLEFHGSSQIAIVGHHDCAGNRSNKDEQIEQLRIAVRLAQIEFKKVEIRLEVIGLWVDDQFQVHELESK